MKLFMFIFIFLYSLLLGFIAEVVRSYSYFFFIKQFVAPGLTRIVAKDIYAYEGFSSYLTLSELMLLPTMVMACLLLIFSKYFSANHREYKLYGVIYCIITLLALSIILILILPLREMYRPEISDPQLTPTYIGVGIHMIFIFFSGVIVIFGLVKLMRYIGWRKNREGGGCVSG